MDNPARAIPETLTPEVLAVWDARIHILNNPTLWTQMLIALGIPSVLLGVLVGVVSEDARFALLFPLVLMGVMLGIFVLVGVVIDLMGGLKVRFLMTDEGVRSLSGKGAQTVSAATVAAGLLAGSAAVAGAGLLARSEQDVFIPWGAISKVRVDPDRRVVTVRAGWADKPIALYCTPENFAAVLDILRARVQALMQ